MNTKTIYCEKGCGTELGTLSFPYELSEVEWEKRLKGYMCQKCTDIEREKVLKKQKDFDENITAKIQELMNSEEMREYIKRIGDRSN